VTVSAPSWVKNGRSRRRRLSSCRVASTARGPVPHGRPAALAMWRFDLMLDQIGDLHCDQFRIIVALNAWGRASMKRDWDLIREILLAVQARPDLRPQPIKLEGYDDMVVAR